MRVSISNYKIQDGVPSVVFVDVESILVAMVVGFVTVVVVVAVEVVAALVDVVVVVSEIYLCNSDFSAGF